MKIYAYTARKAARKYKARPFQLEYILQEPGATPRDMAESARLVIDQINFHLETIITGTEFKPGLANAEEALKAYKEKRLGKEARWILNNRVVLNLLNNVLPEYDRSIHAYEENKWQCRNQRREFIDFLNATRSPYSRPISYNDRSI